MTLLRRRSEETDDSPEKLVYPLEHSYTPLEHSYTAASLSYAGLKGADAAKAATLLAASSGFGFRPASDDRVDRGERGRRVYGPTLGQCTSLVY